MAQYRITNPDIEPEHSEGGPPPLPPRRTGFERPQMPKLPGLAGTLVSLVIAVMVVYLVYLWFFVRIVVGPDQVLVLLKKNGSQTLPGSQVVVPAPPENPAAYAQWEKQYGDCNGILERPVMPGTYFSFSPFDYERYIFPVKDVPQKSVGIVIRKFGAVLPPGQVLADESKNEAGPLPEVKKPGRWPKYSNPFAYEIKMVDPIQVPAGSRGVVTIMAGKAPAKPNDYLVAGGEQGVQAETEEAQNIMVNLYERRITPISVRSQKLEMTGVEAIEFPSADSFPIRMEGVVEWSIDEKKLPLKYVEYGEGGGLIEQVTERVIKPYSRSFSRLVGSQYSARDFISGDTKLKFQTEFESKLRERCAQEGIIILQALVRDIVPPEAIKTLINEREIAKQQISTLEQQITASESKADLARQEELANQNKSIGDANTAVVTTVTRAQQNANVAITQAKQELAVAKLRLEAAQKEADARVAGGQAAAAVILLGKEAEAKPLQQQVAAFGGGDAFAQFVFYQKVAPSIKSILTSTDGVFADIFREFAAPASGAKSPAGSAGPNTAATPTSKE